MKKKICFRPQRGDLAAFIEMLNFTDWYLTARHSSRCECRPYRTTSHERFRRANAPDTGLPAVEHSTPPGNCDCAPDITLEWHHT
jgi:hypothetical protein